MPTAFATQAVLAYLPIFTILILILCFKWSAAKAAGRDFPALIA
jgi:hypothetical protein